MAKINESTLVVRVSKLVKDNQEAAPVLDAEVIEQLEAVIQELAGEDALVEIDNGQ